MNLYLTIGIALCFFSSISLYGKKFSRDNDNNFVYCYISLLLIGLFWFLTAFRSSTIGADTFTYIRAFKSVVNYGLEYKSKYFERGYIIFSYLISKITSDPHVYLIIHASLCYIVFLIYIFKYSKNILVSTTFLFCIAYSNYTNILRQDLAMVICLIAYCFLKKKKQIGFVILVLLASTMHTSALIFLFLMFHKHLPKSKKKILLICCIAIMLSLSGVIISILSGSNIFYSSYAESKYAGTGYLAVIVSLIRAILFSIIYYFAYPEIENKSIDKTNLFMLLILNCLGFSINIFTRISTYFLLPLIVEIPNCFYTAKLKDKKWILLLSCFGMILYFIVICIYRPQWNPIYPYEFWH